MGPPPCLPEPLQRSDPGARDDARRHRRPAALAPAGHTALAAAGYDLIYVYAGHNLSTVQHFLSRRFNDRSDEYGGTLENRVRLLREILEDTMEECEGRAAVACASP